MTRYTVSDSIDTHTDRGRYQMEVRPRERFTTDYRGAERATTTSGTRDESTCAASGEMRLFDPQVSCSFDGAVGIVSVTGELDMTSAPGVWRTVHTAIGRAARSVVVVLDLSGTSFLDSLGITTLINLHQRSRRQQVELRVVAEPGQAVRRVISLAGVDTVLSLYDSLDEARTAPAELRRGTTPPPPICPPRA